MVNDRALLILLVVQVFGRGVIAQDDFLYGTFPRDFLWGTATSAYQVEGAWNLSGKGENIWDRMIHSDPSTIIDGSNADVAADSYARFNQDVQLIAQLGLDFYRFSLSWSRILPKGRTDVVNPEGVAYYNQLIDALIQHGIQPMVTLSHWDLPQALEDEGGWLSEQIVELFAEYAELAFSLYGDRVKWWITLNEPWVQAVMGYGWGANAPRIQGSGTKDYVAGEKMLKAHARAWHIYNDTYKPFQRGECGLTLDALWYEPKASSNQSDIDAAERAMQFKLGWFAHPVFSAEGDYPKVMKDYVAKHSQEEGLSESRLPELDPAWISYIRGTFDFLGFNHYTTNLVEHGLIGGTPSYDRDQEIVFSLDESWPGSAAGWLKVVPWGFRRCLNWIKKEYGDIAVIITENGYADNGDIDDPQRQNYITSYIDEVLKSIELDGCNVKGYAAWSLIDNFEWTGGYTARFGICQVDFTDPTLPRQLKNSARLYKQIVTDNGFPALQ